MASDRELLEKAIHESITRELAVSKKWLGLIHFEDGVVSSKLNKQFGFLFIPFRV